MRAIKQVMTAKQKNSRFFDYFLKKYGDSCTTGANEEEIMRNIKQFYNDLSYGNIQQQKYLQYLYADPRVVQLAVNDSLNRLTKSWIQLESLKFARAHGLPATTNELFPLTLNEVSSKYNVYSAINQGLSAFLQRGDLNLLVQISVHLNNAMNRGTKIEF